MHQWMQALIVSLEVNPSIWNIIVSHLNSIFKRNEVIYNWSSMSFVNSFFKGFLAFDLNCLFSFFQVDPVAIVKVLFILYFFLVQVDTITNIRSNSPREIIAFSYNKWSSRDRIANLTIFFAIFFILNSQLIPLGRKTCD